MWRYKSEKQQSIKGMLERADGTEWELVAAVLEPRAAGDSAPPNVTLMFKRPEVVDE